MTNKIVSAFQEPRIKEVVAQVAATQASNLLSQQITPEIESFRTGTSNTLAQFDNSLQVFQKDSTNALADVRSATEFSLIVAKASCDDRGSFVQLLQIASDKNSPVSQSADSVATFIMESVNANTILWENQLYFKWELFGINPNTNSLQQFKDFYLAHSKEAPSRFYAIRQIFNDNRFSETDRYDFLGQVLQQDNSLIVVNEACSLIDKTAGLHFTIGAAPLYYQWIEKHRASFTNAPVMVK
jgi:hypothetical protein